MPAMQLMLKNTHISQTDREAKCHLVKVTHSNTQGNRAGIMIQLAGNAFKGKRQPTADKQPPGSLDSDRTLRPEAFLLFKLPVDFLPTSSWYFLLLHSTECSSRDTLEYSVDSQRGRQNKPHECLTGRTKPLVNFPQSAKITIISTVLLQEGKLFGSNWDYQHFGGWIH